MRSCRFSISRKTVAFPLWFRSPPRRARYFLFRQKVPKNHCACGGDLDNVLLSRLPLPLADRAPARTPASLQSNMRALLARSATRLRHHQRRGCRSATGHPWPSSKREPAVAWSPCARTMRANGAPRTRRADDGKSAGWRTGSAPVRRRPMDGPSANPGDCERTRSTWMCEGRVRGVAFSLVTFLLATQEKVTRAPGGARNQDTDIVIKCECAPSPGAARESKGSALRPSPEGRGKTLVRVATGRSSTRTRRACRARRVATTRVPAAASVPPAATTSASARPTMSARARRHCRRCPGRIAATD